MFNRALLQPEAAKLRCLKQTYLAGSNGEKAHYPPLPIFLRSLLIIVCAFFHAAASYSKVSWFYQISCLVVLIWHNSEGSLNGLVSAHLS